MLNGISVSIPEAQLGPIGAACVAIVSLGTTHNGQSENNSSFLTNPSDFSIVATKNLRR